MQSDWGMSAYCSLKANMSTKCRRGAREAVETVTGRPALVRIPQGDSLVLTLLRALALDMT